jgi:DNA repair photolyase
MAIIYVPKGRAREYSPLAANLYDGCSHGCKYCYAPGVRKQSRESFVENCKPRKDILEKLAGDMKSFKDSREQVLLSFIGDPYCPEESEYRVTRGALELFLANRIPTAVLTKGGQRARRDTDLFLKFGRSIKVGASLTFYDEALSLEWEPRAASPQDRLDLLAALWEMHVHTWASLEPVIDPDQSLRIIQESMDFVDEYRLGKLNNFKGLDSGVNWSAYLAQAVALLRLFAKPFYVKQDLREAAPNVPLFGNEVLMDEWQAQPFEKEQGELL